MAARTFLEFFAGGGMVREALGRDWRCLFANDFDEVKAQPNRRRWYRTGVATWLRIKKTCTR